MKNIIILCFGIFFLSACNNQKNNHLTLWVNGFKEDCEGVGNVKCLQIQEGDTLSDKWKLTFSEIKGFNYQQGYIYKLAVEQIINYEKKLPIDTSLVQYQLIEILDKKPDPLSRLHDIWALKDNVPVNVIHPYIELNISKKRLMGIDGCNNFNGSISKVDKDFLEFGPIAGTKKMCINMKLPDEIVAKLPLVRRYSVGNNELVLKNEFGENLLIFKKVD